MADPVVPSVAKDLVLELRAADGAIAQLRTYAGKIGLLLNHPGLNSDPERVAPLDDLLGAVYALMLARHYEFEDRADKQIEVDAVRHRAAQAEDGSLRLGGKWLAGYHFNNAVFRIAAVQHRVLQVFVSSGRRLKLRDLYARADAEYQSWSDEQWQHTCLNAVREQVNELKHDPIGIFVLRKVSFESALGSVGELLGFMEAWIASPAATNGA